MTDKELRKLKRAELLEILYYLRKELDELKAENEAMKARIDDLTRSPEGEGGASVRDDEELLKSIRSIVEDCISKSPRTGNNAPKGKGRK